MAFSSSKSSLPSSSACSSLSPLVLPIKVPVRNDLVYPLAHWLDSGKAASTVTTSTRRIGSDHIYDDDYNYDEEPRSRMEWVVPKPEFSSVECRSELLRLSALRNCLSENLQDGHQAAIDEHNALEDCCDYHATVLEFEKRGFPAVEIEDDYCNNEDDNNNNNGSSSTSVDLTWKGAFATKQQETHHSLCWDRACTLWNIAALQSFLAAKADRTTREGCKVAISQYQAAASNIVLLQQLVQSQTTNIHADDDTPLYSTVDMSKAMLSFWEKIFLAQAQHSIYKLANLANNNSSSNDNGSSTPRQHSTLAYLIQAAAARYNQALIHAKETRLQSEVPRQSNEWSLHCKAQSLLCQARAVFHMSIDHRLHQQHGMEIARLQQCVEQLKEVHTFFKSANMDITRELQRLTDLSRDRLTRAKEDNRNIYLEDIPSKENLPEIRAQHLVKENIPLAPELLLPKVPLFEWCK